jgi:hypothetical protein
MAQNSRNWFSHSSGGQQCETQVSELSPSKCSEGDFLPVVGDCQQTLVSPGLSMHHCTLCLYCHIIFFFLSFLGTLSLDLELTLIRYGWHHAPHLCHIGKMTLFPIEVTFWGAIRTWNWGDAIPPVWHLSGIQAWGCWIRCPCTWSFYYSPHW